MEPLFTTGLTPELADSLSALNKVKAAKLRLEALQAGLATVRAPGALFGLEACQAIAAKYKQALLDL